MIAEVKEANSGEVTRFREDWDGLTHKIHQLKAEADASQILVREISGERNEMRTLLEKKQSAMRAEDDDFRKEIETLLAEFALKAKSENPEAPQRSGLELLKHFAEVAEKSAETLAKRAEVSCSLSCSTNDILIVSSLLTWRIIAYQPTRRTHQIASGANQSHRRS